MSKSSVLLYKKKGPVAYITFNRPEKFNCFNGELYDLLEGAIEDYAQDQNLRCAIISGSGGNFSSGGDLKWWLEEKEKAEKAGKPLRYSFEAFKALDRLRKPLVAAIDGWCIASGMNVAVLYADIKIASDRAKFQIPSVKQQIVPGQNDGGYAHPWLLHTGLTNALYFLLTGKAIPASEALRMGLVNEVVPADHLMASAEEIAETICQHSPEHVALYKEFTRRSAEVPASFLLRLQQLAFRPLQAENYGQVVESFVMKKGALAAKDV